jgi:hypothetical protein
MNKKMLGVLLTGIEWQTDCERYTRAADQARLARNALARTADTTARRGIA